MTTEEYFEFIDFTPLLQKIKESGLKTSSLAEKIGCNPSKFTNIKNHKALPDTLLISVVASYFNVPVSSLVNLSGFEYRDFFVSKEFTPPENPEHKLTYQPLRDTVEKHKREGQTIQDLFDRIPKKDMNNNSKKTVEYMLIRRGILIDENTEKKSGKYTDASGRTRRAGGLSQSNRTKIKNDESVSFRIIYDICKIMRCNVDFVLGWK